MALCCIKTVSPSTLPILPHPRVPWRVESVLVVTLKGKPRALHSVQASITELQALGFGLNWEFPCVAQMSLNSQEAETRGDPHTSSCQHPFCASAILKHRGLPMLHTLPGLDCGCCAPSTSFKLCLYPCWIGLSHISLPSSITQVNEVESRSCPFTVHHI